MNATAFTLLGYAVWTLALLGGIAVLRGRSPYQASAPQSPFSARLCRAHANCYENLPAFASIVLLAIVGSNAHITVPLALWALAVRISQATAHLVSTSNRAVQLRFAFLFAQFLIQLWWIVQLVGALI